MEVKILGPLRRVGTHDEGLVPISWGEERRLGGKEGD